MKLAEQNIILGLIFLQKFGPSKKRRHYFLRTCENEICRFFQNILYKKFQFLFQFFGLPLKFRGVPTHMGFFNFARLRSTLKNFLNKNCHVHHMY